MNDPQALLIVWSIVGLISLAATVLIAWRAEADDAAIGHVASS
jgi:hypothetical protein